MMKRASASIAITLAMLIVPIATSAEPGNKGDGLIVRLVDASGTPVAGARVGAGAGGEVKSQGAGWTFYSPQAHSDADGKDLNSVIGGGSGAMAEYLAVLSHLYGLSFLDETKGPSISNLNREQHDSSLDRDRLAEILQNLSEQTSLEFRREMRPVDTWTVVKE